MANFGLVASGRICHTRAEALRRGRVGFTLIELLVVVAIIALLISILLPSLSAARAQAKAVKCGANQAGVGKAMAAHLAEAKSMFPLAYYYPSDASGTLNVENQPANKPFGYVHWSYSLFDRGAVQNEFFQCPEMEKGGHPRTNPGTDEANWFEGQQDDTNTTRGNATSAQREDKQATFMAYTANAAVMPRNKFGGIQAECGGSERQNQIVRESMIENAGQTIMVTEFNRNHLMIATGDSDGFVSKAHRPVHPFWAPGGDYCEYSVPGNLPVDVFQYFPPTGDGHHNTYGLWTPSEIENAGNAAANSPTVNPVNAVGRHHPGGDKLGGTANFLYVDGHVARKTAYETLADREWGRAYYGLTGRNRVSDLGWTYLPPRP